MKTVQDAFLTEIKKIRLLQQIWKRHKNFTQEGCLWRAKDLDEHQHQMEQSRSICAGPQKI